MLKVSDFFTSALNTRNHAVYQFVSNSIMETYSLQDNSLHQVKAALCWSSFMMILGGGGGGGGACCGCDSNMVHTVGVTVT